MRLKAISINNYRSLVDIPWVEIGPLTVLIGKNNSGKSTFLEAVSAIATTNFRRDSSNPNKEVSFISYDLEDINNKYWDKDPDLPTSAVLVYKISPNTVSSGAVASSRKNATSITRGEKHVEYDVSLLDHEAEKRWFYFLGDFRLGQSIIGVYNPSNGNYIDQYYSQVADLVAELMFRHGLPQGKKFTESCEKILGFEPSLIDMGTSNSRGKRLGFRYEEDNGEEKELPIELFGGGVRSLLPVIVELSQAKNSLLVIDEPERALHPESLRAILELIDFSIKENNNQIIISTHSNIVLSHTLKDPQSNIYLLEAPLLKDFDRNFQTTLKPLKSTDTKFKMEESIEVLENLGYQINDLLFWDAWLFLEESSAQEVIEKVLIPRFYPGLENKLKIVSTKGFGNAKAAVTGFEYMFTYAHISKWWQGKAWIVLDGGNEEEKTINKLKKEISKFSVWKKENFLNWPKHDFEEYFPNCYHQEVKDILESKNNEKMQKKSCLLKQFLEDNKKSTNEQPFTNEQLKESFKEVLNVLSQIEGSKTL